jgi:hypothetical protein
MATGSLWNSDRHFALSISARFNVGQSIAWNQVLDFDGCQKEWETAIKLWFLQVFSFSNSNISPYQ